MLFYFVYDVDRIFMIVLINFGLRYIAKMIIPLSTSKTNINFIVYLPSVFISDVIGRYPQNIFWIYIISVLSIQIFIRKRFRIVLHWQITYKTAIYINLLMASFGPICMFSILTCRLQFWRRSTYTNNIAFWFRHADDSFIKRKTFTKGGVGKYGDIKIVHA